MIYQKTFLSLSWDFETFVSESESVVQSDMMVIWAKKIIAHLEFQKVKPRLENIYNLRTDTLIRIIVYIILQYNNTSYFKMVFLCIVGTNCNCRDSMTIKYVNKMSYLLHLLVNQIDIDIYIIDLTIYVYIYIW